MKCLSCQSSNMCGAIFCLQCGTSLLPQDRKRDTTAALGTRPKIATARDTDTTKRIASESIERRLRATVINNGRRINVPLAVPVLIGRQDSAKGFFPDLDLSNDGGYDSGVSRRHARIAVNSNVAYVEDLDSANGTFINEQRLDARSPQSLQRGDELRLGSLILRIEQV